MDNRHNDGWSDEEFYTDLVPDTREHIGSRRNGGRQAMPEKGDPRAGEIEIPLPEDMEGWRRIHSPSGFSVDER